jgi:endonuclease G
MGALDRVREAKRAASAAAEARWNDHAEERARKQQEIATAGAGAADSPDRQARFNMRVAMIERAQEMHRSGTLPLGVERRMGPTLDYAPFAPSRAAHSAGRPVARLVDPVRPGIVPNGIATGFLVTPKLLITNHHVFPTRGDALGVGANFLYETSDRGVESGAVFELDPDRFYLSDEPLDFAVVAIKPTSLEGRSLSEFGILALIEATPKILVGQRVNIIQYPQGGPKQYTTSNNRLLDILDEGFLQYEADTLEGSSGSPVFSERWELVGLHRASIPRRDSAGRVLTKSGEPWREELGDDAVDWIANEGTRISALVKSLSKPRLQDAAEQRLLTELLEATTDPITEIAANVASPSKPIGPESSAGSPPGAPPPAVAVHNQFHFSGPVTIHVYASPGPSALAPPAPQPPPPAPPPALEKAMRFDPDYDAREGFDPMFLAGSLDERHLEVPLPEVEPGRHGEMLNGDDGVPLVLAYHHFSLAMSRTRRLQMWSAANVDYAPTRKSQRSRDAFGADRWIPDPRIPARAQIFDADFYKPAGNIDRGHMVRREDNAWGDSETEIELANSDTFHWTNCTPQHEAFNQSEPGRNDRTYRGMAGLWGGFENHIQKSRKDGDTKLCLFAGPVLRVSDPSADFGRGPVQYPLDFWKVVIVAEPAEATAPRRPRRRDGPARRLKVFAFLLDQRPVVQRFGIEVFEPAKFGKFQVSLAFLTQETGVVFAPTLHAADVGKSLGQRRTLSTLEDLFGL